MKVGQEVKISDVWMSSDYARDHGGFPADQAVIEKIYNQVATLVFDDGTKRSVPTDHLKVAA